MQQITAAQLKAWLDDPARAKPVLIDVREPWEFDICRIAGSQLIPMRTIPLRMEEIERDVDTVMICHHGARSFQVGMFLEQQGYSRLINLHGGMAAWAQVDPTAATY